jgi:hypothetical protein
MAMQAKYIGPNHEPGVPQYEGPAEYKGIETIYRTSSIRRTSAEVLFLHTDPSFFIMLSRVILSYTFNIIISLSFTHVYIALFFFKHHQIPSLIAVRKNRTFNRLDDKKPRSSFANNSLPYHGTNAGSRLTHTSPTQALCYISSRKACRNPARVRHARPGGYQTWRARE